MTQSIDLLGRPVENRRAGAGIDGMAEAELDRSGRLAAIREPLSTPGSWSPRSTAPAPG